MNAVQDKLVDVRAIVARFEKLMNDCPPELNGRQTTTITRQPKTFFVEIRSSFKFDAPDNDHASIK